MTVKRFMSGLKKTTIIMSVLIASAGCAGNRAVVKEFNPDKVIHISKIKGSDETVNLNDCIVCLDKGDTFPLTLSLKSDFIELKQKQVELVAREKLYFRVKAPANPSEEQLAQLEGLDAEKISKMSNAERKEFFKNYMLYVSRDAKHWAPLNNLKTVKNVLGFNTVCLSFGMWLGNTEGLGAGMNMKISK